MLTGAQRRGQKCQNFPCCGKQVAQLSAHQLLPPIWEEQVWIQPVTPPIPAPASGSTRHPVGRCAVVPLGTDFGCREVLQETLRDEGGGNRTTAGMLPTSATSRRCALGEKGQGAWIGGFKSGEEVEQVLGECGRTWEIKPETLWSARDHATSQEWNHGLSKHSVPPVESCGEQTWKGWAQPGVFTRWSTGREPS